jgi:hypothetical protein
MLSHLKEAMINLGNDKKLSLFQYSHLLPTEYSQQNESYCILLVPLKKCVISVKMWLPVPTVLQQNVHYNFTTLITVTCSSNARMNTLEELKCIIMLQLIFATIFHAHLYR